jgi:hypothetical protein
MVSGGNSPAEEWRGLPVRRPGRHRAAAHAQWRPAVSLELLARVHAALAAWGSAGHHPDENDFVPGPRDPVAGEEGRGRHRRTEDS